MYQLLSGFISKHNSHAKKGSIPRWTSSFIQSFSQTVTSCEILIATKTSEKAKAKANTKYKSGQ